MFSAASVNRTLLTPIMRSGGVVVHGFYEELLETALWSLERGRAWSLLQRHPNWWEPGGLRPAGQLVAGKSDHLFYRIRIDNLTGRKALDAAPGERA
jgi:uncharacterized protein